MSGEEPHYSPARGNALILAHLPDWSVSYVGFSRNWMARSPNFSQDGVSVQGPTPEAVVERAERLLLQWTPA